MSNCLDENLVLALTPQGPPLLWIWSWSFLWAPGKATWTWSLSPKLDEFWRSPGKLMFWSEDIWRYLKVSWKHVAPFFSCFFLLKYTEATGCDTSSWNMVKRHLKNYPCPIFVSQTHSGCGLIFMLEKVEHLEICGKITCINQLLSKPSSKPI